MSPSESTATPPFARFAPPWQAATPLRAAITAATRRSEADCLKPLLSAAAASDAAAQATAALARTLVEGLRAAGIGSGVQALVREYDLSTEEGVSLMCLAEALLRIPDDATRDALIRDKLAAGDWAAHLGRSESLFVNAATWGLALTGRLASAHSERGLGAALTRLIAHGGEPLVRRGVDLAMRMMGEQFVTGQTIGQALARSAEREAAGFRYSFDMLGEAALTADDAAAYYAAYEQAIHAIGRAAAGRGPIDGPGISIKLSALHPRYGRAQLARVRTELMPKLRALALLAMHYDIGLNIDAEESDRLEVSLDLFEVLCLDPALAAYNGLGFVVQAYQKRCPYVIDFLIDLARRSGHRLLVRLVKGAYWDGEIKRAQIDGATDYPVFTRKIHTDVSYLACARRLLAAPAEIFPQFATHNAHTLAAIVHMAQELWQPHQYEFQCLHGMGEPLYDQLAGNAAQAPAGLVRPCRIYAPVGSHETLLAYLVRRLLENGANSSFVNRITDPAVSVDELIADPVAVALALPQVGSPHPAIIAPHGLFGRTRRNSSGLDLSDETTLAELTQALQRSAAQMVMAAPMLGRTAPQVAGTMLSAAGPTDALPMHGEEALPEAAAVSPVAPLEVAPMLSQAAPPAAAPAGRLPLPVRNPADHDDVVGHVIAATPAEVVAAVATAQLAAPQWAAIAPAERASRLAQAADLLSEQMPAFMALLIREAGKTAANAVSEVREAVDFLRYYGSCVSGSVDPATSMPMAGATAAHATAAAVAVAVAVAGHATVAAAAPQPLGTVACISPWNFPLAIFTGQIAAALAAGNVVLAKPAEETPLVAAQMVRLLHQAGIPQAALQLLPGDGEVGAALVADARVQAVVFTGSLPVAKLIQMSLAQRLDAAGAPVRLIAETGGINAMVVDSSALPEQVVQDVVSSAFDSAGQRCSALRLLCVQTEVADRVLQMLAGAMRELQVGDPALLATDVGPVISEEARQAIASHVLDMRAHGHAVTQLTLLPAGASGGQGPGGTTDRQHPYGRPGGQGPGDPPVGRDLSGTSSGQGLSRAPGGQGPGDLHGRPVAPAVRAVSGTFIPPTVIEVERVAEVRREVFGPVLHVMRFARRDLLRVVDEINASGYGLTFGVHSRIDDTVEAVVARSRAGNVYVNRNTIGAVVGVQPFGGHGLSGTGPKAGGPLYIERLQRVSRPPLAGAGGADGADQDAVSETVLPGPVGERNVYGRRPRGTIMVVAATAAGQALMTQAALSAGNRVVLHTALTQPYDDADGVLYEGDADGLQTLLRALARLPGPIVPVGVLGGSDPQPWQHVLWCETCVSTNTAAAGGNATLMAMV